MAWLTFDQAHAYFEHRTGRSLPHRDRVPICCIHHDDRTASATAFLNGGGFHCNACGAKGSIIDFEMQFSHCDKEQARRNVAQITGAILNNGGKWTFVDEYIYRDREGRPVTKKQKYLKPDNSKTFVWYRWDSADDKWEKGLTKDSPRPLYNFPEVITANLVIFVEGEPCADAVSQLISQLWPERQVNGLRIAVTTSPDGAWEPGKQPKWRQEYNKTFSDKFLIILEDNDLPGRTLADHVAAQTYSYANSVRRIAFADKPEHYDIKNWIEEHRADPKLVAKFQRMAESAAQWHPEPAANPEQDGFGLKLKRGTEIVEREQVWEVDDFLPGDTLITAIGEIGFGKTRMAMSWCADISQGRTPVIGGDRPEGKQAVLFISNEDSETWLRKMFVEMGSDLENFFVEDEGSDLPWNLGDIASLEARITQHQPAMVVIDSLSAYWPDNVNIWKHSDVAPFFAKLRKLAARNHCIIVLIHHDNKAVTDDPIRKSSGTKGIPGTARHNILVGPDKDGGDTDRIAVTFKTNLAKDRNRAYRFQLSPSFQWNGQVTTTAREVLKEQVAEEKAEEQSRKEEARGEARQQKEAHEAEQCAQGKIALAREILRRESAKEAPIRKGEAEDYLASLGFTRAVARMVIEDPDFEQRPRPGQGHSMELHIRTNNCASDSSAAEIPPSENPSNNAGPEGTDFRRPHEQTTAEIPSSETCMDKGDFETPISAAELNGHIKKNSAAEIPNTLADQPDPAPDDPATDPDSDVDTEWL